MRDLKEITDKIENLFFIIDRRLKLDLFLTFRKKEIVIEDYKDNKFKFYKKIKASEHDTLLNNLIEINNNQVKSIQDFKTLKEAILKGIN